MPDLFQAVEVSPIDADKIQSHLEKIRQAQDNEPELMAAIAAAVEEFNKFFLNYGKPYFTAHTLHLNETAQSSIYNENLDTLFEDLNRLHILLVAATGSTIASFNYSTVVAKEIANRAALAASKVLDLNILNKFLKGKVIVAGDDFLNDEKIDKTIGVDTTQADILGGASAIALLTVDAEIVTTEDTEISITPILPIGKSDSVNTDPTPNNLQRFYEGDFYAPIGEMRPEGGTIAFKYIVDPAKIPPSIATTTTVNGSIVDETAGGAAAAAAAFEGGLGFFAIVPSTDSQKQFIRRRLIDGDPSTFWEAEFVYGIPSLIDPFKGSIGKAGELKNKTIDQDG